MITMSGQIVSGKPTGPTVMDTDDLVSAEERDYNDVIKVQKTIAGLQPMTAREALNSVVPQAVDYAMAVVRGSRTTGLGGSSERLGGYEETLG